ncbi:MAG: protein kinase [Myxococcales bacterium]|nr:protein kinase [Myxococcales bacterium]
MSNLPSRIGPYTILSRLGAGGMGETYAALRRGPEGFEQRLCLKLIRSELAGDSDLIRQFSSEARIGARLRHANIVQVIDFGQHGGDYYLALELVDGADLRQLLGHTGALPPELVLHLAVELATALDIAHRAGIEVLGSPVVHRDVSPANVLISREGEIKLTDFGIARPIQGPVETQSGIVKGKVGYMAPEYARSGRFDERCDLFGLGVLLFEAAADRRPFEGTTDLDTLERSARGERPLLHTLAPELPASLSAIIEQLIEPDPVHRFQSAAALLEALLSMPAPSRARQRLAAAVRDASDASAARTLSSGADDSDVLRTPRTEELAATEAQAPSLAPTATRANPTSPTGPAPPGRSRLPLFSAAAASLFALGALLALALGGERDGQVDGQAAAPDAAQSAAAGQVSTAAPLAPPPAAALPPPEPAPAPATTTAKPGPEPKLPGPARNGRRPSGPIAVGAPPQTIPDNAAPAPSLPAPVEAAETTTATADPGPTKASLEVVVLPYGKVSIDGRALGASPVKVALTPGSHTVVGQNHSGPITRQITLRPGQQEKLILR